LTSSCTDSIIGQEKRWDTEHPMKCSSTPALNSLELHLVVESASLSVKDTSSYHLNETCFLGVPSFFGVVIYFSYTAATLSARSS